MPVRLLSAPLEPTPRDPIAIVGIGCRLPGGVTSPQAFWDLLREGRDAITEVPASRWDLARHFDPDPLRPLHHHVRHGGFVEDIDQFDAAFFGISPREAVCMDPQQRLLLEAAWRALEDGGQPVDDLRGQPVGVFIGISSADYSSLLWASGEGYATPDNEPFVLPGNTGCIAANRLSYFFDLKGPSFTVDTACSSSLVAVHLACESLWRGESTAALAGGVQALIHPGIQMSFCKAGLLSADGRCKSFDASADGYVRSEGAGVVLLKPLAEARRCGDPIYALIHGTAVNSDGRSNGMAAPNLKAQIACVREAFSRSGLEPAAAQYVEAHGTGTRQGDPIELRALGTVLGEGRPEGRPCRVGSVKTNLGHGETAAGITGLIKAALCVHHRQLPPSLHFRSPNPAIDFAALKLQVQTRLEPFPASDRPAVVGVSSFGFGGTNAHVVLAEAPLPAPTPIQPAPPLQLQLFTLSARTPAALRASAARHGALLRQQPQLALADVCATANQGRSPFRQRLVVLARDGQDLARRLEAFAAGEDGAIASCEAPRRPGKVAVLLPGEGAPGPAVASGLYADHPVFREAFDRAAALAPGEALAPFALGYALSQLWFSWGLQPDLFIGDGVGELLAAHLSGDLDLAEAAGQASSRLAEAGPAGEEPHRFAAVAARLADEGCRLVLELGAGPSSLGHALQARADADQPLELLPSLEPGQDDWAVILRSLGALYLAGQSIDWRGFHSPFAARPVALPGYPFEGRRHWWSGPGDGPGPASLWLDHLGLTARPEPAAPGSPRLERLDLPGQGRHYGLSLDPAGELQDHRIRGQVIVPAAALLLLAHQALARERRPLAVEALQLDRPLRLEQGAARLQLLLEGDQLSYHSRAASGAPGSGDAPDTPEPPWRRHGQLRLPAPPAATALAAASPVGEPPLALEPTGTDAAPLPLDRFYGALARCGLDYGPRYRSLESLRVQGDRAWAQLARPAGAADAALLDGCFQAVAATLDPEAMTGQLVLPVGLEAMALLEGPGLPDRFGCQVQLLPSDEPSEVRAHLLLHAGDRTLGWIRGFRLRRLPRQAMEWMFPSAQAGAADANPSGSTSLAADPSRWLLETVWRPLDLPSPDPADAPTADPPAADAPTAKNPVAAPGEAPLMVGAGPGRAQALTAWLEPLGLAPHHISWGAPLPPGSAPVLLWPDLRRAEPGPLTADLLAIAQQLAAAPQARPVLLVLEGEGAAAGALEGLAKTAALEAPALGWARLHLPADPGGQPRACDWPGLWTQIQSEPALRWQGGRAHGPRLERLPAERFQLVSRDPGRLEALALEPLAPLVLLPGEVELAVEATGLNFRDVLNALGLLQAYGAQLGLEPGARMPFGGECVGRVVAIGPGVDPELLGQRVLGALAVGSLASHVACRAQLCVPLPEGLDPHEAAGLSTAFLSALYGLVTLAQLQPGETVLIHAAAGGVGQAALQVARRRGARILATASGSKQAVLLEQGVEAVFDSRSLAFSDQVLAHTGGRGVDVVLNSLKGDWVEASFRCLAAGGRFVELGKIDTWSRAEAAERRPDARYLPFDLLEVAAAEPALLRRLLLELLADRAAGHYRPLPLQVLPIERVEEAFRLMAQARHVGKLVIRLGERPAPLRIRPDATYLVSGGLGGVGQQLLRWLADQGATSLLVVGRSADRPGAEARQLLDQLAERGVTCTRLALDLGSSGAAAADQDDRLAAALAALPLERPLRGVIHAAGVLDDGLIGGLTPQRLAAVLAPKLGGWCRLEAAIVRAMASEPPFTGRNGQGAASAPLDFILAFSSLASLLGSPGQAAYGAANGALEGLCRQATSQAPEAAPVRLAIQWGPWAGAGMAAEERIQRRFAAMGIGLLQPDAALGALEALLRRGRGGVVAVLDNDWARLAAQAAPRQRPLFEPLLLAAAPAGGPDPAASADSTGSAGGGALRQQLAAASPAERRALVLAQLQRRLAQVMGLGEDPSAVEPAGQLAAAPGAQVIDPGESLFQLGLDSLMAVEFAAGLQADLGIRLELESLEGDPSLESLAELVLADLAAASVPESHEPPALGMAASDPATTAGSASSAGLTVPAAPPAARQSLDLGEQARLSPHWRRPAGPAAEAPGSAVLLTGATGFLGAYLLAGQLRRWPELELRCLVRCGSPAEGLERIRANLARYGLWREQDAQRLRVVPGDLAQPRFGLDPAAFAQLAEGLGGILHNGAQLSQMASYGQLAAANVGGTRTALELATLDRPLSVQLISSVAVFEADAYRDREILETDDLPEWRGIHLGYSQTKWVSERLVLEAGRAGLPVTVYRPPLIGGDSRSGIWHQDDLLQRLLQGCLALGLAPDVPWPLDLVPVDYVADAVTALAWTPGAVGHCFHLQHPQPVMLADLLGRLITHGASLELVPMPRWLEAIEADPGNPLHPLRPFFQRPWGDDQLTYPERNQLGIRARPSARASVDTLRGLGVRCPSFEELLAPYAQALVPASTASPGGR